MIIHSSLFYNKVSASTSAHTSPFKITKYKKRNSSNWRPWQDAVVYELNEWLDKRSTISYFNIGLDPQLFQLNFKEQQDRQNFTIYAANDCLSMQRLLMKMQIITITPTTTTITNKFNVNLDDIEPISSDDEQPESEQQPQPQQQSRHIALTNTNRITYENQQPEQLTIEQRKQAHNRTCTLKQRKRLYKHEIIRRGIDR
ncbi:unnamed protein product [Rotaria sp. Silwood2]|nr:unnamed protein product [Rotaria sp. Silwood2]CAF2784152.1 unnamed protein product [Rotaria sp. Silwood2]CAF3520912.1 unnamed protein product [Rotaria sp. Silwood2]CAF4661156.1 unnamed protein product [Rotaria sp. Silwood2]CAF4797616.1 unnamed protein product [Rotaria sp. Silwood2]